MCRKVCWVHSRMSLGACRARTRVRFLLFLTCVLAAALVWTYSHAPRSIAPISTPSGPEFSRPRRLARDITVIFRQFEDFDHDLAESARSWSAALNGAPALVLVDRPLYPPLSPLWEGVRNSSVREVSLELSLSASPRELDPLSHVRSEFVLFVPDSSRPPTRRMLRALLARAAASPANSAIVLPAATSREPLLCQRVQWSYRDWTLRYERAEGASAGGCDGVRGRHALLARTALLRDLPQPFLLPFPEALYLQTNARNVKVQVWDVVRLGEGRALLTGAGARARASRLQRERRAALYRRLGVKRLTRDDGDVQWYGCTRDTERCFPAVLGAPSYLAAGRNTPPCCLRHLHRTARHVLHTLLMAGARCWLEASTLLGAVTRGQLAAWAERGELGVHAGDVGRVSWLQLAAERGAATDDDGYVWERATSGHYYRVAYSHTNRIYVDILPFAPRNGTMTKDGWFLEHQREFPEHFLHPMGSVKFSGVSAPAPNNVREFLQLKFGPNVIENSATLGYKLMYP